MRGRIRGRGICAAPTTRLYRSLRKPGLGREGGGNGKKREEAKDWFEVPAIMNLRKKKVEAHSPSRRNRAVRKAGPLKKKTGMHYAGCRNRSCNRSPSRVKGTAKMGEDEKLVRLLFETVVFEKNETSPRKHMQRKSEKNFSPAIGSKAGSFANNRITLAHRASPLLPTRRKRLGHDTGTHGPAGRGRGTRRPQALSHTIRDIRRAEDLKEGQQEKGTPRTAERGVNNGKDGRIIINLGFQVGLKWDQQEAVTGAEKVGEGKNQEGRNAEKVRSDRKLKKAIQTMRQ